MMSRTRRVTTSATTNKTAMTIPAIAPPLSPSSSSPLLSEGEAVGTDKEKMVRLGTSSRF